VDEGCKKSRPIPEKKDESIEAIAQRKRKKDSTKRKKGHGKRVWTKWAKKRSTAHKGREKVAQISSAFPLNSIRL